MLMHHSIIRGFNFSSILYVNLCSEKSEKKGKLLQDNFCKNGLGRGSIRKHASFFFYLITLLYIIVQKGPSKLLVFVGYVFATFTL